MLLCVRSATLARRSGLLNRPSRCAAGLVRRRLGETNGAGVSALVRRSLVGGWLVATVVINLAATVILTVTAIATDGHVVLRMLAGIGACGAALATATRSLKVYWHFGGH